MKKYIIIASLFALQAFGAGELIPPFANEQEKDDFLNRLRRQIPFSDHNSPEFLNRQIRSIESLRKRFPDYDKWIAEKPDPLTIEIFHKKAADEHSLLLEEATLQHVRQFILQHFAQELQAIHEIHISPGSIGKLQYRSLEKLKFYFERQTGSVRGLMTGLAQIVPPAQKSEFFKLGDPYLQLDFLQKLEISDEQLQKSNFRAEILGFSQSTVTYPEVLNATTQRLQENEQIFLILSYLKFLNNISKQEFANGQFTQDHVNALITNSDFDFAYKANSSFIAFITGELSKQQMLAENLAKQKAEQFQSSFSRLRFEQSAQKVETKTLIARVIEVHPHLGTHRGCIGGDCSTTNSPMFPYSPWEHIFYVQNPLGGFLGYVSATRVTVDGVEAFYLKDLNGIKLSGEIAEEVLQAFVKIYPYYGAKKLILALPKFTNIQNRTRVITEMLAKYNQLGETVSLTFPDKEVRSYISSNSVFTSYATYDSVSVHSKGVVFSQIPSAAALSIVETHKATLPVPNPQSRREAFLMAIQIAIANPNTDYRGLPIPRADIFLAESTLRNQIGLKLDDYYAGLKELFARHDLELNRAFRDKYELLFMEGHLNARDAFKHDNPAMVAESERLLIQYAKLHKNHFIFLRIAKKWKDVLKDSTRFKDFLNFYANRMAPQDVYQLFDLALDGFDQAREILSSPERLPQIEMALLRLLEQGPQALGLIVSSSEQIRLSALNAILTRNVVFNTVDLENKLTNLFSQAGINWRELKNRDLQIRIEQSFLDSAQIFWNHYVQRSTQIAIEHLQAGIMPPLQMYKLFLRLKGQPEYLKKIAKVRFEQIKAARTPLEIAEFHLLNTLGVQEAGELLRTPEIQKIYLKVIEDVALKGTWLNYTPQLQHIKNAYPDQYVPSPFNLGTTVPFRFDNTKVYLDHLRTTSKALLLDSEALIDLAILPESARKMWLQLKDAYHTTDPRSIRITIKTLEGEILGGYVDNWSLFPWDKVLRHYDYLAQWPEFKQMLRKIEIAYFNGDCHNCGEKLVQFVLLGKIKDEFSSDPEKLKRMLGPEAGIATLTYGLAQAKRQRMQVRIDPAQLRKLTEFVGRDFNKSNLQTRTILREMAVDALATYSYKAAAEPDPKTLSFLEKSMILEPKDLIAVKMALAYIKQGGQPYIASQSMTKMYPRPNLQLANGQEEKEIYAQYFKVINPGTPSGTFGLTCKLIFEKRLR